MTIPINMCGEDNVETVMVQRGSPGSPTPPPQVTCRYSRVVAQQPGFHPCSPWSLVQTVPDSSLLHTIATNCGFLVTQRSGTNCVQSSLLAD